ncbi:hypothetical protein LTR84_005242 [Exophiala bonariae]|uniref:BZIP domain-containing protein n=1 Tax=Exophiala bonariae TaxID=1690606 RepID=A0AAV9NQX8_9EURO|nr:hypothetical protein LTR84_005242 [Exophiala bonariae]
MSSTKSLPKRKADDIDLPVRGQDPAERKRVLNVLAQRRYRQRKKEHIEKLEAHVKPVDFAVPNDKQSSRRTKALSSDTQPVASRSSQQVRGGTAQVDPTSIITELPIIVSEICDDNPLDPALCFLSSSPTQVQKPPMTQAVEATSDPFLMDPFVAYDTTRTSILDGQSFWATPIALPSISNSPESSTTGSSSRESVSWSLPLFPLVDEEEDHTTATTMGQSNQISARSPTNDLQYCFPDEAHLEVLELTLLRGCMMIATRLNVSDIIWSLTAQSPFTEPFMAFAQYRHLPANLQPTMVQMTVPHHPIIDLLPWPRVRDRMITILSQPPEMRPPQAASQTALLDFVYDIEDSSEGMRLSGSDPYSANNWEVGEKVFSSWWWIFDRDILRRSNELRQSRGAPLLGSQPGTVLGEVA